MPEEFVLNTQKMKEDILRWVIEAETHWQPRIAETEEYIKRYEAKRSVAGLLWGDDPKASPKNYPWSSSSDIGIPIEAFTIEGLLPRFLKVCYGATPLTWVKGRTDDDMVQAPIVQEALNFQLTKHIKIYRRMKTCFKNTVMSGDGIVKCVWETEYKIINRTVYYVQDSVTGQFLTDEMGKEIEVGKDDEIPAANELTGNAQQKVKKILSDPK